MSSFAAIEGFLEPEFFESSGIQLPVYVSGKGEKPLIVLHELPGMTESFIECSREISERGYKVYMPLMFKSPSANMGLLECASFCVSREFRSLFSAERGTESRPFTSWLLDLVGHVTSQNGGKALGVIGMCLTGNFAIAAIAEESVKAAVACQPSYPFFKEMKTLGMTPEQRAKVSENAQSLPFPCARGYRYAKDRMCTEKNMEAIENLLGDAFERHQDLPGRGHSTVTGKKPSREVFDDIIRFLGDRL